MPNFNISLMQRKIIIVISLKLFYTHVILLRVSGHENLRRKSL